jgi:acetoin utilization protein AcuC
VLLTVELIRASGLLGVPGVEVIEPRPATDAEIGLVHDRDYIDLIRRMGAGERAGRAAMFAGLGPGDNPIFLHMHEATAWVVGASLAAARAVVGGGARHAFNPAGGLHHALPGRASGFCIYNDPAVAIAWIRSERPEWRVLYVDVDAHHGDGVQAVFWDDPSVLTFSMHESGEFLFPGTGQIEEAGGDDARGSAINLPLPPDTGDREFVDALELLASRIARRYRPHVLVTQLGCDSHWRDPLTHLGLTMRAYPRVYEVLHRLAHEHCEGRWVATGGGGYQWGLVVPRAWTLAFAEMSAEEPGGGVERLPDALPPSWPSIDIGEERPSGYLEDVSPGDGRAGDVGAAVDRVVAFHGLSEA